MNNSQLQYFTVMVTRPKPQGERLCAMIQNAGGQAIFFPTIEIVSLMDSIISSNLSGSAPAEAASCSLEGIIAGTLDSLDWLIFVSPQAVYQLAHFIQTHWPIFPSSVKIAALGGGTALALQEARLPVHLYPRDEWRSEGLLALPDFQQITGKKIALVRGEGGRELLANELLNRGANLIHWIVYRRCLPVIDLSRYAALLNNKKIDIIVTTSSDILQNLTLLLGEKAGQHLYAVPLIVVSERMLAFAKTLGFQKILLAKNASHEAIMAILKDSLCQMTLKKQ